VAFAGHNRSEDLGDAALALAAVAEAFSLLAAAGVRRARLLTGLAPGADLLAAEAWRAQGLGPLHAVFPYLSEDGDGAPANLMDHGTWLDGRATEARGRSAHLAQTRWLIGAADLLVVAWTGGHGRGAGGTADAVRLAIEHGVPVLWIKTGPGGGLRLIRSELLDEDFGFWEFLEELQLERAELVAAATVERLNEALAARCPPERARAQASPGTPPHAGAARFSRIYALFSRALAGRPPPIAPASPPKDLEEQPGFSGLTRAHLDADAHATALGALHRSQQIVLLGLAILAATVGSAAAVWPQIKLACVVGELLVAVCALMIWRDSERGGRHEHWGQARRIAEDLRLERVAWSVGVSTSFGVLDGEAAPLARDLRRAAGLPLGRFDQARASAWGRWALDELVAGQAAYHRGQAEISGRIAHRVHQVENFSFRILLAALSGYVAVAILFSVLGAETPHWLGGIVVMTGAIVPAIGAASLALEATLSLAEQSKRSRLLALRLGEIAAEAGEPCGLETVQAAVRSAVRLARAQEDRWFEATERRRLYRGA
jgi:hypothetical protein